MKKNVIVNTQNKIKDSKSRVVFNVINITFLLLLSLLCVMPFINLLAVSLSSQNEVNAGNVWLIPKGINLQSYKYLLQKVEFFKAFGIALLRVVIGTSISLVVTGLMAYPLAFARKELRGRGFYIAIIIVSMFFSGGLIPSYIVITKLGLYNTIWALVLPTAMSCWNMILFINFFRQVPKEIIESASLEGAGHFRMLVSIVVPLSKAVIATVALLCVIGHWNAWFDGYIYMNTEKWPLQTYLYHLMEEIKNFQLNKDKMNPDEIAEISKSNSETLRAAQIFIAMIPVLAVYPIAQKYFVKGIMLGSVKE